MRAQWLRGVRDSAFARWLQRAGGSVARLLFPTRCPVCDGIVADFSEKICAECAPKLRLVTAPYCMKCGKKLQEEGELCGDCRTKPHVYVRGRALYEYESVAASIYRLKYGERREYAAYFGEELAYYLGDFIRSVHPAAVIPIPLHKKRFRKRGYNQAALLARALGRELDIPVREDVLYRIKDTTPMKRLNPKERQNNLKKAFIMRQNDVKLETVIVVDDIYTTGSTIDEATRALQAGGVEKVYYVTLACGAGI